MCEVGSLLQIAFWWWMLYYHLALNYIWWLKNVGSLNLPRSVVNRATMLIISVSLLCFVFCDYKIVSLKIVFLCCPLLKSDERRISELLCFISYIIKLRSLRSNMTCGQEEITDERGGGSLRLWLTASEKGSCMGIKFLQRLLRQLEEK